MGAWQNTTPLAPALITVTHARTQPLVLHADTDMAMPTGICRCCPLSTHAEAQVWAEGETAGKEGPTPSCCCTSGRIHLGSRLQRSSLSPDLLCSKRLPA